MISPDAVLEGLNPVQREAASAPDGPMIVIAGAGSGKTRVLTHRVAFLIAEQRVSPFGLAAITFTNKAAGEMKARVSELVGPVAQRMWVSTFHSMCSRILRREAPVLGYRSSFSIYDQSDAVRLVDYVRRDLDMDPKRFPPRRLHAAISAMKNELVSWEQAVDRAFTPPEKRVADVYREYQRRLLEASALDFDDLLVQTVHLFRDHLDARERWSSRFKHVLVDEFQDTNVAQWELVRMLTEEHRNVMVVGDQDQCLVAGTRITMGDGTTRPIEEIAPGDLVMSCHGSGDFRPARVLRTHRAEATHGIAITTESGRRIVSTEDHVHFAGFVVGRTPQFHMTYVMWKEGMGFRVGTSRTYTKSKVDTVFGPLRRCTQEHADAMWVVGTFDTEAEARFAEASLAARYGLPTLPFIARPGRRPVPGAWSGIRSSSTASSTSSTPTRVACGSSPITASTSSILTTCPRRTPDHPGESLDAAFRSSSVATGGGRRRCTGSRCSATTTPVGKRSSRSVSACGRPGTGVGAGGSRRAAPTWVPSTTRSGGSPACSRSRCARWRGWPQTTPPPSRIRCRSCRRSRCAEAW